MTVLLAIQKGDVINLLYLAAAALFIFGLKMLSSVKTARKGNLTSALGMLLACVVTLYLVISNGAPDMNIAAALGWIAGAIAIGAVLGLILALKTPMTAMPQMVAVLNGFGGIASLLVACADYYGKVATTDVMFSGDALSEQMRSFFADTWSWNFLVAVGLTVLVGGVTFTGSLVAFGKLQGLRITPSSPIQFPGQKVLIGLLLLACIALSIYPVVSMPAVDSTDLPVLLETAHNWGWLFITISVIALILGVLLVIGIGGADMPVVVSLLNSYSGIAAAMAGFVLDNQALIITGALVGASGIILTNIMCKAMNRSLANVLFGGVGGATSGGPKGGGPTGTAREMTPEDVVIQLDAASQVVVVPGYGMAVAQAQHAVAELGELLTERGVEVKYAIHPVAGRMPGHMNVLLAEADVPYEQLCDLETINPEFEQTDVALIIGANDVTNPAARHAKDSPIYGMPILDVDKARSVVVIKRSLSPGFAGIQNELYFKPNCGMLFGDGKAMANALLTELREAE